MTINGRIKKKTSHFLYHCINYCLSHIFIHFSLEYLQILPTDFKKKNFHIIDVKNN